MVLVQKIRPPQPDYQPQNRIWLSEKMFAIVDPENLPWLIHYDWRAVKSKANYYAARRIVRDGHYHYIRMHRQLTNCPAGLEVHHINHNTLDNRKSNLMIVTREIHSLIGSTVCV